MSLEEEHQALHRRGEIIKFLILVGIMLVTVLVVAAVRPMIFGEIVPAVMGWQGEGEPNISEPAPATAPETSTPTATATQPPAESEGESESENAPAGATPTPTPPPTLTPEVYRVQPGDNLTKIAHRYGISIQALAEANRLSNHNRIIVGQELVIPEG